MHYYIEPISHHWCVYYTLADRLLLPLRWLGNPESPPLFHRHHVYEYACIVWSPYYNVDSNRLESIQKQFLLYALRNVGWNRDIFVRPPYTSRCQLINIETLALRRNNIGIFFIYDLLMGFLDAPVIYATLKFNTSRRLRNVRIFQMQNHSTNYAASEPISTMCSLFNSVSTVYNVSTSRESFRSAIRNLPTQFFASWLIFIANNRFQSHHSHCSFFLYDCKYSSANVIVKISQIIAHIRFKYM